MSYFEIFDTLKRIFGLDERVAKFYVYYHEVLKKIKSRVNDRYCKELVYKPTAMSSFDYPTVVTASFVDLFYKKGGYHLLLDIIGLKAFNNT